MKKIVFAAILACFVSTTPVSNAQSQSAGVSGSNPRPQGVSGSNPRPQSVLYNVYIEVSRFFGF